MVKVFYGWGDLFKVEFSIRVTKSLPNGHHNVFHFTGDDSNGSRIPAFWVISRITLKLN